MNKDVVTSERTPTILNYLCVTDYCPLTFVLSPLIFQVLHLRVICNKQYTIGQALKRIAHDKWGDATSEINI